jgi:anti-sigma B factor antagonist
MGSRLFVTATANHDVLQRLGLKTHHMDGVDVISVTGELDLYTAPTLCLQIDEREGPIVLDLSEMAFCDSTGLRALAGAAAEARVARTRLVIVPPQKSGAARAFEIAGAIEFLPLVTDVRRALDAFRAAAR